MSKTFENLILHFFFFFLICFLCIWILLSLPLFHKILGRMPNSVDSNQTAPSGAVWSGSALFAYAIPSLYSILDCSFRSSLIWACTVCICHSITLFHTWLLAPSGGVWSGPALFAYAIPSLYSIPDCSFRRSLIWACTVCICHFITLFHTWLLLQEESDLGLHCLHMPFHHFIPYLTAPSGAVWSGSALFAYAIPSLYPILDCSFRRSLIWACTVCICHSITLFHTWLLLQEESDLGLHCLHMPFHHFIPYLTAPSGAVWSGPALFAYAIPSLYPILDCSFRRSLIWACTVCICHSITLFHTWLLLQEQSDLGLHCLHMPFHHFIPYLTAPSGAIWSGSALFAYAIPSLYSILDCSFRSSLCHSITLFHTCFLCICFTNTNGWMANSIDSDQTNPSGAVWSGSAQFADVIILLYSRLFFLPSYCFLCILIHKLLHWMANCRPLSDCSKVCTFCICHFIRKPMYKVLGQFLYWHIFLISSWKQVVGTNLIASEDLFLWKKNKKEN